MSETKKENIIDYAIEYAERFQCSVIPLNPESKKPLLSEWKPFQNRIATTEEIKTWWTKWPKAMIGIVTGKCSELFVIDVDPGGEDSFKELFPKEPNTPTAITPRNGRHYYFAYPDAKVSIKAGMLPNIDYRGEGGYVVAPPSVNSSGASYAWGSNLALQDIPTIDIPTNILDYIINNSNTYINYTTRDRIGVVKGEGKGENGQESHLNVLVKGRRDEDIFHLANMLFRGGATEEEVRAYLTVFAEQCNPPFPQYEMEIKIQSACKREQARGCSLAQDIRDWISTKNATFTRSDMYTELNIATESDKRNLSKTLERLQKEGVVESVGDRYGVWRTVIKGFDVLDVLGASTKTMPIKWLLDIEGIYINLPKSIVVVAGSPNVGKSAFCLNFAYLNRDEYKVTYITSEMGAPKLKRRIEKFETPIEEWEKIRFIELNDNYLDAVVPDQITVIDFLEVHDEFWRVSGWINDIFRHLSTGMCLIAIQKPRGRDVGRGGEGTLEKPSLYLSMDYDFIKVVKCKEWPEGSRNPNGYSKEFRLFNGCKFIAKSEWEPVLE